MLMRMLEAGGVEAFTDAARAPDEDNPLGYYEHTRVKNLARDPDKSWLAAAHGRSIKIISFLLPQMPPDLRYQVVFVERDLAEVLASQNAMLRRRGERAGDEADDRRMAVAFENHLREVKEWLGRQGNLQTLFLNHRRILEAPAAEAARIARFLSEWRLDVDRMAGVVDRRLHRNRL